VGSNGNGKKQWDSEKIDPVLVDPSGNMHKGIVMPGWDGLPYRGPVPDLKENDPEHLQPQFKQKAHVDVLELWDKKQLDRYRDICQVVANGFGAISKEDMQYDEQKKGWRVFIRWLEFFTTVEGGSNGRNR
jgi:hypothetical protein